MTKTLADMSLLKHAAALSGLGDGTQTLIRNIVDGSNASNIRTPAGDASKEKFWNHDYDKDPATNGGKLASNVTVGVYYMPANATEYRDYDVIDRAIGMLSGRRRLLVRDENDKLSFYMTSHPKEAPGLRTNVYGNFTPIDPSR